MNNHEIPTDILAHLIRDALEHVGRRADANVLAERIKRLDLGIPVEDEFMVLLRWLGKCHLVHKLDQTQIPPVSQSEYRVPDLLAVFDYEGRRVSVLIEVKGKKATAFSWRPDYVEGLRRYGQQVGLPVLIACKWKLFGYWTLFELGQYEQAHRNCKFTFATGVKQNLMSLLAGDFAVVLKKGVGLHLKMHKEEMLDEVREGATITQNWRLRIKDAYFTNGAGERVELQNESVWPLFLSADLVEQDRIYDDYVLHSLIVADEEPMLWAHRALVVLLNNSTDEAHPLNWREVLLTGYFPIEVSVLREAAKNRAYVRYTANQVPDKMPLFLNT